MLRDDVEVPDLGEDIFFVVEKEWVYIYQWADEGPWTLHRDSLSYAYSNLSGYYFGPWQERVVTRTLWERFATFDWRKTEVQYRRRTSKMLYRKSVVKLTGYVEVDHTNIQAVLDTAANDFEYRQQQKEALGTYEPKN